jgi:hypothetical protein
VSDPPQLSDIIWEPRGAVAKCAAPCAGRPGCTDRLVGPVSSYWPAPVCLNFSAGLIGAVRCAALPEGQAVQTDPCHCSRTDLRSVLESVIMMQGPVAQCAAPRVDPCFGDFCVI